MNHQHPLLMRQAHGLLTISVAPELGKGLVEPALEGVDTEENIEGSRKLSRAHSSGNEFCNGVPVSSSRRFAVYMFPNVWANLLDAFFMRCPSSTTMYSQPTLLNTARSLMTYS